jgi:formylglycine-generating enzyme required for sulfatase activity
MAEPEQPPRPRPPIVPGTPLPRTWKAEPDAMSEAESRTRGAAGAGSDSDATRGKAGKQARESRREATKPGKAIIEETPSLDTYQARRTVRIAVGFALAGLVIVLGSVALRLLPGERSELGPLPDEGVLATKTAGSRDRAEREARSMFERARDVARIGNLKSAVALLTRVTTVYKGAQAAREAQEALDRPSRNLPLFPDGPALVADQSDHVARSAGEEAAAPEASVVVEATGPAPSGRDQGPAQLVLPANPAEPSPPLALDQAEAPAGQQAAAPSHPLPRGFRARPAAGVHASGWPRQIVGDRDGATMVLIPGGGFTMGRDDGDPAEAPAHPVTLATYYIDQHEVTVRQYAFFLKETNQRRDLAGVTPPSAEADGGGDNLPVVNVSATDARDFAAWAGKRLPTEAQWEMAARAPDSRPYPWGEDPPAEDRPRTPRQLDPVLSVANDVSPLGVCDLAGNAWEWTKDWFDSKYYQSFRVRAAVDPTGPAHRPRSRQLVVKGGSRHWVVSWREGIPFETRLPYLGFRCVLPVEGPGNAFEVPAVPGDGRALPPPARPTDGLVPF